MNGLIVNPVGYEQASEFVARFHYAVTMPSITKAQLGIWRGTSLVGVATWGYGTRPMHTIKALFPSLDTPDYLELGRLCVSDDEPRNTESWFLSRCAAILNEADPKLKVLFSWADGMRGKPGYVYQGAGWLYGGFIWTDAYLTERGEIVHPRLYQNKMGEGRSEGLKCGKRPSNESLAGKGWKHYFGKQFRYCKFLGGHGERKRLLKSASVEWTQAYPKMQDLEWKIWAGEGSRVSCEQPSFAGAVRFRNPAPLFDFPTETGSAEVTS